MTMHVAVAGWLLGPPSGANRRLLALLAHAGPALAAGERVTVLHARPFSPPSLRGIAWRPIDVPAGPTVRRWWRETRVLAGTLRELGASVLDHGFLPLPRVPVPVCLVVHDLRAVDGFAAWPRWLARAVLRSACARAAAVVAPSAWTAGRLRALAAHARIEVVPNGVELPAPAAPPPLPFAAPPNGYLLHVGHLEPRKNLGVVVDALRALPAAARPELWLAGRDAGALASLRARAGDVVVRPLGVVDEARLAALYGCARAVVVPSLHEGFGLPALEGLAHGCVVLASDAGALPEVVGAAGTVLPARDAAAWAAAIAAGATGDREARRSRAAAFSWSATSAQQVALWRRVHAGAT